jgi:two-component system, chemotaxis family, chemotaxis protein CheY
VRCCGHEVVAVVGSGLEAIQAFSLHKPDVVVLDYRMPKLNGATACRHILARDPKARVVLLSAWSPLDGADEAGATCFLPKPVDLARLSATLLTISQSIPAASPIVAEPFQSALNASAPETSSSNTIVPFVSIPIPQEIISPIEHFPITPVIGACDVDQAMPALHAVVPATEEKRIRKNRPPRARKKLKRAS